MVKIKVKTLTRKIISLTQELGLGAVPEYRTPDGTRIDVAILRGGEGLLAIELEASFKWFPQRILYDIVKVYRAGFPELWIVTPFTGTPRWVLRYAEEIGLAVSIMGEKETVGRVLQFLGEGSLGVPGDEV